MEKTRSTKDSYETSPSSIQQDNTQTKSDSNIYLDCFNFAQQDAHEFLLKLLPLLKYQVPSLFLGKLLYENPFAMNCTDCFKCLDCKKIRMGDSYESLCLSLFPTQADSLMSLLKKHFESQFLDDVFCDKCDRKTVTTMKKTDIFKIPSLFSIHLNRIFSDDHLSRNTGKIYLEIECPDYIELSTHMVNRKMSFSPKRYELVAFVQHLGFSSDYGHYITTRKDPITGNWWKISDSHVKYCKSHDPSGAYILLYKVI